MQVPQHLKLARRDVFVTPAVHRRTKRSIPCAARKAAAKAGRCVTIKVPA